VVNRRSFPDKVKAQACLRAAGKCEKCTARLYPGKFAYDHVIPDAMGGEPVLSNCEVLCTSCHGEKTTRVDVPTIAKVKRIAAKHNNYHRKPSRPMPGSRASGWKAKIGGGWERRT
jgi:5-methylcytosine-specific restriction protein A